MDKVRESRRGTVMSVTASLPRRRSRTGSRDSSEEADDFVRERSSDRSTWRRKLSRDRDDVADGSTDESFDEEHDEEDETHRPVAGSIKKINRTKPRWKVPDEMIGVPIPRKARSASVKRLQDSFSNVRKSTSPSPVRAATPAASVSPPSSSTASLRPAKKVKPVGNKSRPLKTSKMSISESEVEVAQFLYGLTRLQSHESPAKLDLFHNSLQSDSKHKRTSEGTPEDMPKTVSTLQTSVSQSPSSHPSPIHHDSDSIAGTTTAPKRKKPRSLHLEGNSKQATVVACFSKPSVKNDLEYSDTAIAVSTLIKTETEKKLPPEKTMVSSSKLDEDFVAINSPKQEDALITASSQQISTTRDRSEENPKSLDSTDSRSLCSTDVKEEHPAVLSTKQDAPLDVITPSISQKQEITPEESSSSSKDFLIPKKADVVDIEVSKIVSPRSFSGEVIKEPKFEIDLMAPPKTSCPDEEIPDVTEKNAHQTPCFMSKNYAIGEMVKSSESPSTELKTLEPRALDSFGFLHSEEKHERKETTDPLVSEGPVCENKIDLCPDETHLVKGNVIKQQPSKQQKITIKQAEKNVSHNEVMIPTSSQMATLAGWSGGLPSFGYMGSTPANLSDLSSLQGVVPIGGSSTIPNAPFIMLPQSKLSRCSTHCYIARFIHCQQQLAKFNPLWHPAGSTIYAAKPYNLSILPQSDGLIFGASVIRSPNLIPNTTPGSCSILLNGHSSKDSIPSTLAEAQRIHQLLPQTGQQGATFILPPQQTRPGGKPNNTSLENGVPTSSSTSTAPSSSTKTNITAISLDPQYMTMLQNNYPFAIPPAYRAQMTQQPQPTTPMFPGPFYPSQLLQVQTPNQTTSPGSSSQKHLQPQHPFPPKSSSEQTKANGGENNNKKIQNQNLVSFPQNFAIMSGSVTGKQPHPNEPNIQMSVKGTSDASGSAQSAKIMLKTMADLENLHYLHNDKQQPQISNHIRPPPKSSGKANELEAISRTKQHAPAISTPMPSSTTQPYDRAPTTIFNAGSNYMDGSTGTRTKPTIPTLTSGNLNSRTVADMYSMNPNFMASSSGYPNVQNAQWKMLASSQKIPIPNASVQIPKTSNGGNVVTRKASSQSSSTSSINSSRKATPLSAPSSQGLTKTQQLFFSNADRRSGDPSPGTSQNVFQGVEDVRRANNQHTAGTSGYAGKGSNVHNSLGGSSSIAVMAAASYAQSAAASYAQTAASNLSAKSADPKQTTA